MGGLDRWFRNCATGSVGVAQWKPHPSAGGIPHVRQNVTGIERGHVHIFDALGESWIREGPEDEGTHELASIVKRVRSHTAAQQRTYRVGFVDRQVELQPVPV